MLILGCSIALHCSSILEKRINQDILPCYNDNLIIPLVKILNRTILIFSFIVIMFIFISKCAEVLSKDNPENILKILSASGISLSFKKLNIQFKPFLIMIICNLIAEFLILHWEYQQFQSKRVIFEKKISDLFNWHFSSEFLNFTKTAEKFINFAEDLVFAFYISGDYFIWSISILSSILLSSIYFKFYYISTNKDFQDKSIANLLSEFLSEFMNQDSLSKIITLSVFIAPFIFFFFYFFEIMKFFDEQKAHINKKIISHLKNSNKISTNFKNLYSSELIMNLIYSLENKIYIGSVVFCIILFKYFQYNANDGQMQLDFNRDSFILVFPMFLLAKSFFKEQIINIKKPLEKMSESLCKISILKNLKKIKLSNNNDVLELQSLKIQGLSVYKKHKSGIDMTLVENVHLTIKQGEKVLIYFENDEIPVTRLMESICNLNLDIPSDTVFIESNQMHDISRISIKNWQKLFFICSSLNFKEDTIFNNFRLINPKIQLMDLENALEKAGLEISSSFIIKDNLPKSIKFKILVALLFCLDNKELVCLSPRLLEVYNPEEIETLFKEISKTSQTVIIGAKLREVKGLYTIFHKIYQLKDKNLIKEEQHNV